MAGTPQIATAFELPPMQQGSNIDDCTQKLESQGGGWCEIRQSDEHPSISSVWPQNLDRKIRMVVGPRSVLIAWNGAAFDAKDGLMYFMGGGHADYGGNEVYEFNLKTGKWARLTDPSPLDYLFKAGDRYCWMPDVRTVPGSSHTYDGLHFNEATKTIVFVMLGAANGACFKDPEGKFEGDPRILGLKSRGMGIFEFNPSRTDQRNGLDPLTWRRIYTPNDRDKIDLSYPRIAETTDGRLLIGNRFRLYEFDMETRRFGGRRLGTADYGDGLTVLDRTNNVYYTNFGKYLFQHGIASRGTEIPGPNGKSLAVNRDGVLFMWNGTDKLVTFDPASHDWKTYDWSEAGPRKGNSRVYSKWQYVPSHDVFVGLSSHETGVWIYKHPADMPDMDMSEIDPQHYIDKAKPGDTVTIPPGRYRWGLFINKSLTVKLKDVHLWGVAKGKGIINVNCDGCSVIIEDFHAEGRKANCIGGNCAAIKAEGIKFDLTVRRAKVDNTVMGFLTDNRGGRLRIEDSVVENTGLDDETRTLGHGIYAGDIDELIVRRTTVRNVNGNGHLLKSRAPKTTLDHVRLLGEKGYHSRSIDFPCGGSLTISNSIIQHSENTDNPDIISVGTEVRNCREIAPSTVSISDSWIIIDRDRSDDERARTYGPNILFRWRAPMTSVSLAQNHIVNLDVWSTKETEKGDVILPDLSDGNQICNSRKECDLGADAIPTL